MIVESGARDAVESMINEYHERASKRCTIPRSLRRSRRLTALADAAVRRSSSVVSTLADHRDGGSS